MDIGAARQRVSGEFALHPSMMQPGSPKIASGTRKSAAARALAPAIALAGAVALAPPRLAAAPARGTEDPWPALVEIWNQLYRVVALERRVGGRPPVDDQIALLRRRILPRLEGRVAGERARQLDAAELEMTRRNEGTYRTLAAVLAAVKKERGRAHRGSGLVGAGQRELRWKPPPFWVPLDYFPLAPGPETPIDDPEELLVLLGWKVIRTYAHAEEFPVERFFWLAVERPPELEAAERRLLAAADRRWRGRYRRKKTLLVRMARVADTWVITRLSWLDR
jgi:hypothetical protein